MDKSRSTRRRFIRAGAVGLVTGIAGCGGYVNEDDDIGRDYPEERETKADEPDGDYYQRPNDPPATFQSDKHADFTYHKLPFQRELPHDLTDMDYDGRGHPDNTLFHVEIAGEKSATATIKNVNVTRDIDLTLHVRDANDTFQTAQNTLTATDEDAHETREVEFNISNIDLPTGTGSICDLTGKDTHDGDDFTMLFKRHQFVGIPHENGINWVNNENFNYTRWLTDDEMPKWIPPRGVNGNPRSKPAGHVAYIDEADDRIVFLATRNTVNGEVYGVSCHVKHEPYEKYANGSQSYRWKHDSAYECKYATDISHLEELAQKTDAVITDLGISDATERLEALGDLVQTIPYGNHMDDDIPATVVLYDQIGDCSNKSGLFSGIVQNSPWNMMPGFIRCYINGNGHRTIGIDVRDLSSEANYTVSTDTAKVKDGFPDTEYAFFDMTYDSFIGERTSNIEDTYMYDLGDYSNQGDRSSNTRPNY